MSSCCRPEQWSGAVVNVGGGAAISLSLREASLLCREITGHELDVGCDPTTRAGDVRVYLSDCRALRRYTKWAPRRSASEIMSDTYAWIHDHERLICRRRWRAADGDRDRHRLGWADRLGVGPLLRRAGIRRDRRRERHAGAASLARRRRPRRRPNGSCRRSTAFAGSSSTSATPTASAGCSRGTRARSSSSSTPRRSRRTTGPRRIPRPTSRSTPTARSTCSRPPASTHPTRRSSSPRRTRSTAIGPTSCRWRSATRVWSCPPTIAGTAGSTQTCRSTSRPTRCSASRRPRPTCSCRSTAATSRCPRCAFAAAASPGRSTPAPSCTASSPTS